MILTKQRKLGLRYAILAGLSLTGYLLASHLTYRLGFPLDDAWIHQGYARNLARTGEWAFLPGRPSAGATAPLWVALLAPGQWLHLNPVVWSALLGWLNLALLAWLGYWTFQLLSPERRRWAPWVGAALAMEWHLVWAAGSGMETLLAALLFTYVLYLIAAWVPGRSRWRSILLPGFLIGLSVWVRPDAITLWGPLGLILAMEKGQSLERFRRFALAGAGFALTFVPYLAFNRALAGSWWPNTFYAKQAEYAILRLVPYWLRYLDQFQLPLVGAGILLLPGFVLFLRRAWARRAWGSLAGVLWWLGYVGLYAWRLPVTYQHGRYLMPAMPIYFLWGAAGLAQWVGEQPAGLLRRSVNRAWTLATALVLLAFWGMGARAFAQDVAFIESEMVEVAHWLATESAPQEIIAAHDIGAIGYFTQRDLLDLAGLVSPEVIPFIRDETRLAAFLDAQGAHYLVTFPGWYPRLVEGTQLVYQTDSPYAPAQGGEHMAVYRWNPP